MIDVNLATLRTLQWITYRGYKLIFSTATSVSDLKRKVATQLFRGEKPTASFIKGAKITNWETVYKFVKDL